MYSLFFDYALCHGFRGLILDKTPVRDSSGSMKSTWLIGVVASFECKDELKDFCKQRGGGWEPIKKYWWVPLNFEKQDGQSGQLKKIWAVCQEVIDGFGTHIMMAGRINLAFEAAISVDAITSIKSGLLELITATNERNRLEAGWQESPKLTSVHWVNDTDEESAHEQTGTEGHYEGMARLDNSALQKVEVCGEEKPVDFDLQKEVTFDAGEYRLFLAEDGKSYWCKPAPTGDRYDLGCWMDASFDDCEPEIQLPKPPVDTVDESIEFPTTQAEEISADVEIAVICSKSKEPVSFSIKLLSDEAFKFVLPAVRRLPSRVWREEKKAWYVPVAEAQSVQELIEEYTTRTNGMRSSRTFALSPGTKKLLEPATND